MHQLIRICAAASIELALERAVAYLACTVCTTIAHPSTRVTQAQADPLRLEHVIRHFVRVGDGPDVVGVDVALVAECLERAEDADVFILSGLSGKMTEGPCRYLSHSIPQVVAHSPENPFHQGITVLSPSMPSRVEGFYSLSLTILCPVLIRRVQPSSRVNVARPIADTVRDIRGGDGNVHYGADKHDLFRSAEDFYTTRDL